MLWYNPKIEIPYQTFQPLEGEPPLLDQVSLYFNFEQTNYDGGSFRPLNKEPDSDSMGFDPFAAPGANAE